jgi:hypothetical protein
MAALNTMAGGSSPARTRSGADLDSSREGAIRVLRGHRQPLRFLPVTSCVLDGEAVTHTADGWPDFYGLRSADGAARAVLFAFDLLELDAADMRGRPLTERRSILEELVLSRARACASPRYTTGMVMSCSAMPAALISKASFPSGKPPAIVRAGQTTGARSSVQSIGVSEGAHEIPDDRRGAACRLAGRRA